MRRSISFLNSVTDSDEGDERLMRSTEILDPAVLPKIFQLGHVMAHESRWNARRLAAFLE